MNLLLYRGPLLALAFVLALSSPGHAQWLGLPFSASFGVSSMERIVSSFDLVTSRYLLVYFEPTGPTTAELRGQLLTSAGGLSGFPFVIEATAHRDEPPTVCNLRNGKFVVGYRRNATAGTIPVSDTNWYVRTLDVSSLALSNRELVPFDLATTGAITEMVLGGDSRVDIFNPDDRALLVVRRAGTGGTSNSIAYAMVDTDAADPVISAFTTLTSPAALLGDLAVSAHAGTNSPGVARWLVVWCQSASLGAFSQVRGRLVDTDGSPCGASTTIHTGLTVVGNPTVAGRGIDEFAVAFEHGSDLRVRQVEYTGACGSGSFVLGTLVDPVAGTDNADPALSMTLNKYLLTWRRSSPGFPSAVYVKGLARNGCSACSQEWAVEYSADVQAEPIVCARVPAGDLTTDDALVAWTAGGIARARRYEAISTDLVVDVGGGCTNTGSQNTATHYGELVIGNPDFQFVLASPTVPPLALILGLSSINLSCGGCTIVPSLDIVLPGISPTTFAMPCDPLLIGANLWTQWILLKPSSCPILPDFSFTNALRFTIGE